MCGHTKTSSRASRGVPCEGVAVFVGGGRGAGGGGAAWGAGRTDGERKGRKGEAERGSGPGMGKHADNGPVRKAGGGGGGSVEGKNRQQILGGGASLERGPSRHMLSLHIPSLPPHNNSDWNYRCFLPWGQGSHPHCRDGHPCSGGGRNVF